MYIRTVKTKDIDAVEGKSVSLPCPISAPLDDVYMVLWFRDNAGIPLYRNTIWIRRGQSPKPICFCVNRCSSFDVRDKMNSDQARHWSAPEVFGSRAKFHFDSQPATLEIKVGVKILILFNSALIMMSMKSRYRERDVAIGIFNSNSLLHSRSRQ
uniref:Ig-like domain-containing protein n=1 Tax=Glossina austeni TaxID=7395 RepID=A0A1A9UXK5_GLOAU